LFDHVKVPPIKEISITDFIGSLTRKMSDVEVSPMHHAKFHQMSKPANSSHKNLLSLSKLGPYIPAKAQVN
jgi:hypothetical protein